MTLFRLRAVTSFKLLAFFLLVVPCYNAYGQETVFDVPSADVLDAGKVYGELDGTVRVVNPLATFTPRVVVGVGHGLEVGANFDGLSAPTLGQLDLSNGKVAAMEGRSLRLVLLRWGRSVFSSPPANLQRGKLCLRSVRKAMEARNARWFWRI